MTKDIFTKADEINYRIVEIKNILGEIKYLNDKSENSNRYKRCIFLSLGNNNYEVNITQDQDLIDKIISIIISKYNEELSILEAEFEKL